MTEQLSPNLDTGNDGGINKPQEASLHPRSILGDNLPANQRSQTQPVKKTPQVVIPAEPTKVERVEAMDDVNTETLTVQRLLLRALFGGSSFSFQAAMLRNRRLRAKRASRRRQTPDEIMLAHARSVIGNPDQNTEAPKKAA